MAERRPARIDVLAFVGEMDADILPFFLAHYRRLGVSGFRLVLHGHWPRERALWLKRLPDVRVHTYVTEPFSEPLKTEHLTAVARTTPGAWLVCVDTDEFLELPLASLSRTVAAMQVLGIDSLPALLLQRVSADGSLPRLEPGVPMDRLFPLQNFTLCEDLGVANPVWKTKFPLARVTEDFSVSRGFHLPHNGRPAQHVPLRAVVHHFKWRSTLLDALSRDRGSAANQHEMSVYARRLAATRNRLPMANARPLSRADLFARGLLVRPGRADLLQAGSRRRPGRSSAGNAAALARSAGAGHGSTPDWLRLLDPANLDLPRGRICLVAFELAGPSRSGGVGTAMAALAELLAAAGHRVDVIYCPYHGAEKLAPHWLDFWKSRGVGIHYHPWSHVGQKHRPSWGDFSTEIVTRLQELAPDLIHFHEVLGIAAAASLLKAAGRAFTRTGLLVTVHGPTNWHRRGNGLAWSLGESEAVFHERRSLRWVDLVCFPSRYMAEWSEAEFGPVGPSLVLRNPLQGANRSFHPATDAPRKVDELVFFGRIEPRKGVDRFIGAIRALRAGGAPPFKVVFLGKFGEGLGADAITARLGGGQVQFILNYDSMEALNYLRNRNALVVLASQRDNLPYTFYECLEAGIPVVATTVGGIPEMVAEADRERVLVADQEATLVASLRQALEQGFRPARLTFDPAAVDLSVLAVHARLVAEARGRPVPAEPDEAVTAIAYGPAPDAATAVAVARGLEAADVPLLVPDPASEVAAAATRPATLDALAEASGSPLLLFCEAATEPLPGAVAALRRLLRATGADAAVGGFRVGFRGTDGEPVLSEAIHAPAGPTEIAASWNLYGAGLFLIRAEALKRAGGFRLADPDFTHWELLGRLAAAGGLVAGLPEPVAVRWVSEPDMRRFRPGEGVGVALAEARLAGVPPHLEDAVRLGIAAHFGRDPQLHRTAPAPA